VSSSLVGVIIAVVVIALLAAIFSRVSASMRVCPHCHTMMSKSKTTCPKCGKGIPLNY